MMLSKHHDYQQEVCDFLADYAAVLLGCGATCIRIHKNVMRIAQALDVTCNLVVLPSNIILTLNHTQDDQTVTCQSMRPIRHTGINYEINTNLSKLSWDVFEKRITIKEAQKRFTEILNRPRISPYIVLVLASAANASFCRLFGGDAASMALVFFATLVGFRLKQVMLNDHIDVRLTMIASAFFAAVIGAGGYVFNIGSTPELALGTSVLFLIPGIPYINATSDLLDGHYLCSFARFLDAATLTACISLGLCGSLLLLHLKWLF